MQAPPAYSSRTRSSDTSTISSCKSSRRILKSQERGTKTDIRGTVDLSRSLLVLIANRRFFSCACDVPSHCYTWSFEPKTDWSANYASSKEIFKYFKDFSTRHGLDKYIALEHEVVGATWDEETAQWHVQVKDLQSGTVSSASAHVLINAGGILNAWRYPPIPGIQSYKGDLVHSAAWPQDLDLKGKVVGLIGNG